MDIKGLSAVVTGGASGLGAATARMLAAKGAKVALFDLNAEAGEALAKEIGGTFCEVNVTSDDSVEVIGGSDLMSRCPRLLNPDCM